MFDANYSANRIIAKTTKVKHYEVSTFEENWRFELHFRRLMRFT